MTTNTSTMQVKAPFQRFEGPTHPIATRHRGNKVVAVSFWIQGAVLACWARQSPVRACLLVFGFTLLALWHLCKNAPRPSCAVQMAAKGGAGMAVGSWADHAFTTPECLCCIYDGHQSLFTIWRQIMTSMSVGLMLLLPLLWQLYEMPRQSLAKPRPRASTYLIESAGMVMGMVVSGWLGSYLVRQLHGLKLEVGFGLMLAGMVWGGMAGSLRRSITES